MHDRAEHQGRAPQVTKEEALKELNGHGKDATFLNNQADQAGRNTQTGRQLSDLANHYQQISKGGGIVAEQFSKFDPDGNGKIDTNDDFWRGVQSL